LVRQAARDVAKITDMDARYAATLELVKADIALGRKLGVQSTPTFFINGTKVEGGLPTVYFDQAIAYELKKATSQ
jgi:protein-disulfide isomerase